MRILVADDDRVISHLVSTALRKAGHTPVPAFDAMQTLMFAMRAPLPDAIILDLNMPGGGGFETLKKLKSSARTSDIPVIVLSGDSSDAAPGTVKELGAAAFVSKPLVPEIMLAELERILAAHVSR